MGRRQKNILLCVFMARSGIGLEIGFSVKIIAEKNVEIGQPAVVENIVSRHAPNV